MYSIEKFAPEVSTSTAPRQKNCVPIVTTNEGIPIFTTIIPLSQPIIDPANKAAMIATPTRTVVSMFVLPKKDVPSYVNENATIPIAVIDGNERSISFAMITMVRGMAMMAKKGVEVMKAEYIRPDKNVLGAAMIKISHRIRKTPKIPS